MSGPMTIKGQWDRYFKEVVPRNASPIQIMETRRTFYAASHVMLLMMRDGVATLPEDQGVKKLDALHKECIDFANAIGRGEA